VTEGLALWAYGAVKGDAPGPSGCPGVDPAHQVELIRHAGLAAVVSPVPVDAFGEASLQESLEDLERLERLARAHNDVLQAALQHGAVVPFRICTIYESATRVKEMLACERIRLTAVLERIGGMAEWGVKVYANGGGGPEAAPSQPASGTDYLRRRRAERDAAAIAQRTVDSAVEDLHTRLRRRAADAVLHPPQPPELSAHWGAMVLNAAYLVADGDADAFGALIAALAAGQRSAGLDLVLTGPWPAYNFTEVQAR
jgi:hypothetical protein